MWGILLDIQFVIMAVSHLVSSGIVGAIVFAASYYTFAPVFSSLCASQGSWTCGLAGDFSLASTLATFAGMIVYYMQVGFKFESKKDEPPALMWLVLLLMTISRTQVFWWDL